MVPCLGKSCGYENGHNLRNQVLVIQRGDAYFHQFSITLKTAKS